MSKFWSETIRNISPYVPGEHPRDKKYIKLNTNENPYPPSPGVIEAIARENSGDLRLYPDPEAAELKEALAKNYGLQKDEVFVGNGSDEVLAFCFPAFFNPGDTISFPEITYSFYPVYADLFRVKYETPSLNADFSVAMDKFPREAKGILLANPNAPTGIAVEADRIEALIRNFSDSLVIVDEAYVDFGTPSVLSLVHRYDNLLVVQTFSKSRSLAGLRIGFAAGNPALIEGLERVKNSFNSYTLDRIAQKAAVAALKDSKYYKETSLRLATTRENTTKRLKELSFTVLPSKTNFLFVSHPRISAGALSHRLRENGILVRHFQKPGIDNWLRITIGTEEEMEVFVENLKQIVV